MPKPNFPSFRKYKVKNLMEDFPSLLKIILNLNFNVKGFIKIFQIGFCFEENISYYYSIPIGKCFAYIPFGDYFMGIFRFA